PPIRPFHIFREAVLTGSVPCSVPFIGKALRERRRRSAPVAEPVRQDGGLAVLDVPGGREEGERPPARGVAEALQHGRAFRLLQFGLVAAGELLALGGVVAVPLAQLGGRRHVLLPPVQVRLVLRQPPRPHAVDQDPRPVVVRDRLVHPAKPYLHDPSLPVRSYPPEPGAAPAGRSSAADVSAVMTSLPGGAARNSPSRSPAAPPQSHPGASKGTLRARRVRRLRRPRPGRGRTVARGAAGELGGGGAAGELAGQGAAEDVVLGTVPFEVFEGLGEF